MPFAWFLLRNFFINVRSLGKQGLGEILISFYLPVFTVKGARQRKLQSYIGATDNACESIFASGSHGTSVSEGS
jgi:hypothetical protein